MSDLESLQRQMNRLAQMVNSLTGSGAPLSWAAGTTASAVEPAGVDLLDTWFGDGSLHGADDEGDYWLSSMIVSASEIVFNISRDTTIVATLTINRIQLQAPLNIFEWNIVPETGQYICGAIRFTSAFQTAAQSFSIGTSTYVEAETIFAETYVGRFHYELLQDDIMYEHVRKEMLLPSGDQNGNNTLFYCPVGTWEPSSVIGYLNGVAMPESWMPSGDRTVHTVTLGGPMPALLVPNISPGSPAYSDNQLELRVSYDMNLAAASSGDPLAEYNLKKSRLDILTDVSPFTEINVGITTSDATVECDALFEFAASGDQFYHDNRFDVFLNGRYQSKDSAAPWVPSSLYASGDRIIASGSGVYECNVLHTSGVSYDPTKFAAVTAADAIWMSASGIGFPIALDSEDSVEILVPYPREIS